MLRILWGEGEMIKLSWAKLDTWNLDDLGVEKGIKSKCRIVGISKKLISLRHRSSFFHF